MKFQIPNIGSIENIPSFEESLEWVTRYISRVTYSSLDTLNALKIYQEENFASNAIAEFYDFTNKEKDSFYANPLDWNIDFSEPQLTKSIVNFLDCENETIKYFRTISFLEAIGSNLKPSKTSRIDIFAEYVHHTDGPRRIDIMICWDKSNIHKSEYPVWHSGVVIEAKINSQLQNNQLLAYEKITPSQIEQAEFHFICHSLKNTDILNLRDAKEYWNISFWHKLLRSWEIHLTKSENKNIDDADFRLFRATLWEQVT